jgi:hypothetical protein
MARGVTISQEKPDIVESARSKASGIPIFGQFVTGVGKQGNNTSLYTPGSIPQTIVEKGIVGFLTEGFQKKMNPTRIEVGEMIDTRYEKLLAKGVEPSRALEVAITDVIKSSDGNAQNIKELKDPEAVLTKEEKDALWWTNALENAFAVLDAPIIAGATKIAKAPIVAMLREFSSAGDILPILKNLKISDDIAQDIAPKIAESRNELNISKIVEDAIKKSEATQPVPTSNKTIQTIMSKPEKTSALQKENGNARLSETEKEIETRGFEKIAENEDGLVKQYIEENDNYVSGDNAKDLFDDYKTNKARNANAIQEPASYVAKRVYTDLLEANKGRGDNYVLFTGGGTGSGKTTAVKEAGFLDNASVIYDSNMATLSSSAKRIDQALEKGYDVELAYVYTDIDKAFQRAIDRSLTQGRTITIPAHIDTHSRSAQVFQDIIEKYKGDERVDIKVIDNSGGRGEAKIIDTENAVEFFKEKEYNAEKLSQQLYGILKQNYTNKHIDRDIFKGFAGDKKYATKATDTRGTKNVGSTATTQKSSRKLDKPSRENKKLEAQVDQASSFENFYKRTGITREALDVTVQKKGFKNAEEYYKSVKSRIKKADSKDGPVLSPTEVARKANQVLSSKKTGVKLSDKEELELKRLEIEFTKDAVEANPARQLSKYAPKVGEHRGTLPEVTGIGSSEFARRGDDIVTELGYENTEVAREEFQKYLKQRDRLADMIAEVQSRTEDYRSTQKILQALKADIKAEGESRQRQLSVVRDFFKFSTNEWNRILKKTRFQDPRLYTDSQWSEFMEKLDVEGEATFRAIERRVELKSLIWEREFKKTENLFQAMGFPSMENMTEKQIGEMIDTLENFKIGDEFLTKRQIETVKHTDIKDIRTIREALDSLAKDAGVAPGSIGDVVYKELDEYRYDSALARQNPFYDVMVTEKNRAFIEAGENVVRIRENLDTLISKARSSRKRGLLERVVPTDKKIFAWLEADALNKQKLSEDMTAEEIEAGQYVRNLYEQARDYLVQMQVLKKYRTDYITHIRRGFLETWKDNGLIKAFGESFNQYKQDEAYLNILDGDTGEILPLEKFFQFSMKRTGAMTPTQNVAKAVEAYFTTFERKVALDSLVPKIDIYAHALSPRVYSDRGLELDRSLKKFTKKWLNTKKGRVAETIVKPGGRIDWILRSGVALTRMIDLGFSIPTGVASFVGEQAATFTALGARKMTLGSSRMLTKRGQEVLKQNKTFIGESTLSKLRNQGSTIGDKLMTGMFSLFAESARTANAQYLLGSLTKQEFKTGEISAKRLAELRKEMGRYRVVDEAESVMGKTSLGKVITQYRTWAVPIMSTTIDNLKVIQRIAKRDGVKAVMKRKETHELFRSAMLAMTISLAVGGYARSLKDKKDKNFAEELVVKAYRDSLTLVGAMDPNLFASQARFNSFVADIILGVTSIVTFENGILSPEFDEIQSGEDKGKNRGLTKLFKSFTPKLISQFSTDASKSDKKESNTTGPGSIPKLPDLPNVSLPKLPDPPTL